MTAPWMNSLTFCPVVTEAKQRCVYAEAACKLGAYPFVRSNDHFLRSLTGNTDHIFRPVGKVRSVCTIRQTAHAP